MHSTQLVEIDSKDLIYADWNYKTDGSPEQIDKLCNSIKEDNSAGVVAVREMNGMFEVIDGNHRLKAVKKLGWKKVPCENFGEISKAKAITIARRRNHKWFDDDILAYADLFKNDILREYTLDDLEGFMPESREEMERYTTIADFDWSQFDGEHPFDEEENLKTIKVVVNEDIYNTWLAWKEKCSKLLDYESDSKCMELALVEALNVPDESLH